MAINLHWDAPAARQSVAESAPEIAPPDSNKELRTEEEKHQNPPGSVPPGFLSALFSEAREHIRNGTAVDETEGPVVMCRTSASHTQQQSVASQPAPVLAAPSLTNMILEDLRDTERLITLYDQAVEAKLLGKSEAEQLAFFALAQHVIAYGPANPGGLFRQLLTRKQFHVITQAEEDAAVRRLKRHWYGKADCVIPQAA